MSDLPVRVRINEEGPREGFQSEAPIVLSDKVRLIDALAATGLVEINCAAFVDPRRVPQMADADELSRALPRRDGVRYTGMWLNARGFERALASGFDLVPNVVASASDTFSRKNTGASSAESLVRQGAMLETYQAAGVTLKAVHLFTAFGCHYEGPIRPEQAMKVLGELLAVCRDAGAWPEVAYLCDTIGAAHPEQVNELIDRVRSAWPDLEIALHLHDTRGMGLANAYAALKKGVSRFDASIGGLGGCPFAGNQGASGNVCTEDLALMCEEMGVSTGLDLDALAACARLASDVVGHDLPGKFMKSGVTAASAISH